MLLDTSGLHAIIDRSDDFHEDSKAYFGAAGRQLTHSYVVAEVVALGRARNLDGTAVLAFVVGLLADPDTEVVWVGESLNAEALRLLEDRPDKEYSLCDAVSFVLMRRGRLTEALTTDKHFEQEGFRRLLV
jgi:predicted nucleic acid-binding protein